MKEETEISRTVTVEPQARVIANGIGGKISTSDGTEIEYSHYIDVSATAYSIKGITYSGKYTEKGMIAVDTDVVPLGTKVYLTGEYGDYGICTCADIGGGIIGNKIDIWMESEEECIEFGVRSMRIYVLE